MDIEDEIHDTTMGSDVRCNKAPLEQRGHIGVEAAA
jgi:hypothetical protein